MSGLGMAAGIGSAILNTASTIMEGRAQAKSLKAQARSKELQAVDVGKVARYEQWRRNLAQRKAIGTQIATYANLGLELEGTPIENLAETVKELTLERQNAMFESRSEIQGLNTEAKELRKAASRARQSSIVSGVAKGLGSIAGMS